MARSDTLTLIPLDNLARMLQIDPLHFNGVVSARRPLRNACDDVWLQHDWQFVGRCSRDSLAMALRQAEDTVMQYIGYSPAPRWFSEEPHQIEPIASPEAFGVGSLNVRGLNKSIKSDYGYVIAGGQRAVTVVEAGAAVVYSDPDGDGFNELATVVSATALTDPDEIHIFYPGESADPRWEIRPVTVTISGGNATITFGIQQAVLPEKLELLTDLTDEPPTVDGDDTTNFLTTVDVYRVYNDPSQQATFYTEGTCWACDGSGCAACGFDAETGCLGIRDPVLGVLTYNRADWDSTTSSFTAASFTNGREPDRVKIWYQAGWVDQTQTRPMRYIDPTWERMIGFYAITLLDTDPPGCDNTRRIWKHYQENLAKSQSIGNGVGSSTSLSDRDLNNPFGTSFAAVRLFRYITSNNKQLVTAR